MLPDVGCCKLLVTGFRFYFQVSDLDEFYLPTIYMNNQQPEPSNWQPATGNQQPATLLPGYLETTDFFPALRSCPNAYLMPPNKCFRYSVSVVYDSVV